MNPPGRPKGEYRSARHEGATVSPPGRTEGEFRRAEGVALSAAESRRDAAMPRWQVAAVLALIAAFYALTAAGNLSETDDAYHFAHLVQHADLLDFSDPRLLGYHLLARGLWHLGDAVGVPLPALELLRALSVIGATACLWLVQRVLREHLSVPARPAWLATALLGLTYGCWRYAAEADVYLPAMALCAALLLALLRPSVSAVRAAALGACAGAVVLFYQPTAIPLFMVFPLLLWQRGGWRVALGYVAVGSLVVAAGYLAAFAVYWTESLSMHALREFMAQRSEEFMVPALSLWAVKMSLVRSVAALGHDITAANWVFGLPGAEALVQRIFSNNVIDQELFQARQAGLLSYVGVLTLPLVAAATARVLWLARPWRVRWRLAGPLPVIWLWAALTALVIGRLNPAGTEAWIVFLLPLALLFGALVAGPAWARGGPWALGLLVAALGAHNALGGMALVASERGDLNTVRGEWVLRHAQATDLVLVANSIDLAEALRYRSPARVLMIDDFALPAVVQALQGDPEAEAHSRGRRFRGIAVHHEARATVARGGRVIAIAPSSLTEPVGRELHRSPDGARTLLLGGPS